MSKITLIKNGYKLTDYAIVQYEPYIPYRIKLQDGSTDYMASGEKHITEIIKQEEEMKNYKTPEQRIEQLEQQNQELSNILEEVLTVIIPSVMG